MHHPSQNQNHYWFEKGAVIEKNYKQNQLLHFSTLLNFSVLPWFKGQLAKNRTQPISIGYSETIKVVEYFR